jgi:hypothetical protein
MRGTVNFRGVEESGAFELVPVGTYDVTIEEVAPKQTSNGDPMMNVMFKIVRGDFLGSHLWDNIIFPYDGSPAVKIKGRTMHFLHAIGEPYEDKENLAYDTDNWIGKPAKVEVYHEPYNGKTYAKIKEYIIDEVLENDENVPF